MHPYFLIKPSLISSYNIYFSTIHASACTVSSSASKQLSKNDIQKGSMIWLVYKTDYLSAYECSFEFWPNPTSLALCFKACLHCSKMNPDPIRVQSGSVVSGLDVVRLHPHCNNRGKILTSEHHVQPRVPSAWRIAHARAALINFE